ncbi:MAG: DUF4197 domain-containing protein [Deltaproteobacteria bacterium]|nr:DUF4197 domain-containing protein [Deltaproteobacteria bacterium]
MRKTVIFAAVMFLACVWSVPSYAGDDWLKKGLEKVGTKKKGSAPAELSEEKVIAGLKDALKVGTGNTVQRTGKEDGYFKNPDIKIPMPEELKKAESVLRKTGQGDKADEFILSMNRAAEAAAPEAKAIFLDAITKMTFADAKKIYKGDDTAATEYFKGKTTEPLTAAFTPIVKNSTNKYEVTKKYKKFASKNEKLIKLAGGKPFDPDEYVTKKALEGLFKILGEEEKKIRKDPAARVTDLLKEVFGR